MQLNDIDTEVFQNEIRNSSLQKYNILDIERAVKQYNKVLSVLLDKFTPLDIAPLDI